ncbi:hypothetical protein [Planctomycetes bacterium TBK1r]|uniref:Bis(5'-nucleosyl)-tetraphosphatase PrpE [asymmetrical] n=1 Tax=Stieleria magnilauensis TaxID=2527963 RepID=A0ABX5XZD3_9BACT|nr:Bis(5'-nucleosyl)-tetraphosphatase PrpE [asymmetrical] [Planctomycetes bacterium TBK1r]
MKNSTPAYDIIGDVYGHADELKSLLKVLGYRRYGAANRHKDRRLVLVGDFFNRGAAIAEVIEIVRATVDVGDCFAVMGMRTFDLDSGR